MRKLKPQLLRTRLTLKRFGYGKKRPIMETKANLTPVRDNVVVEELEESGLTGAESPSPLRGQETEPSMEVDVDSTLPLASGSAITVSAKEDEMLMGDPTSVAGEMAKLQVSSPNSHKPKGGETSQ